MKWNTISQQWIWIGIFLEAREKKYINNIKKKKKKMSSRMRSERYKLRQRRGSRRIPTKRAWPIHYKPLINASRVEAVVALRNAPHFVLHTVLTQAYRTRAVIGLRQSPAPAQLDRRVRLDNGLVQARDYLDRPLRMSVMPHRTTTIMVRLVFSSSANAYIRNDHHHWD